MADNIEIEHKFLVKGDFRKYAVKGMEISQGYICAAAGRTVRVRIRDNEGFLTIKGPSSQGGLARFEWERQIPVEDARALMGLCLPGVISKTRWLVPNADGIHTWEVDEFHGDNEGLVVAEIELESENDVFDIPDWIGEDVTDDVRYKNSMLSRSPFKDWGR